jgi:hypothetical protein
MRSSIVVSTIAQFLWHVKLYWQAENDEGTDRGLAVGVDAGSQDTRRQDGMLSRLLSPSEDRPKAVSKHAGG